MITLLASQVSLRLNELCESSVWCHVHAFICSLRRETAYNQATMTTILFVQPSNLLLDSNCVVKLADFGLARSVAQLQQDEASPVLTDYVATRWYRAPEILLGSPHYTYGVDMWSSGKLDT